MTDSTPAPPLKIALLNARDAREYLGVSESTLRRVTAPNGPLVPVRPTGPGGRVLYSPAALDRFVAERERAATGSADPVPAGPDLPR